MNPDFLLKTGRIERATRFSAAFDLFYAGNETILIGNSPVIIPTGVRTEFDPQYVCIIKEKSGLSLKGIELKAGVIDSDYRDEWKVIARNPIVTTFDVMPDGSIGNIKLGNWKPFALEPGMKIAQFLIARIPYVKVETKEGVIVIKDDERTGGFGSTGR